MIRRTLALSLISLALAPVASAEVRRWGAFGKQAEQPTPVAIAGIEGEVVKLDSGNASAYALTSTGAVFAWGPNEFGQLGDGGTEASFDKAVRVRFPKGVKIVAIGEERASGFAVDSTGRGWAWGEDASGSNCLGKHVENLAEPQVIPGLTNVAAVQGGATHSVWLTRSGAVMSCGLDKNGELGIGQTTGAAYTPVEVPGLSKVVEVSAGQGVSCARTSSGAVFNWGDDEQGQIGNGKIEEAVSSPYQVPLPEAAAQVSCGGNLPQNGSTLALLHGGSIYGWGDDERGQLGDGQTINKAAPVAATATANLGLTQVVSSGEYSLGLDAQGHVYAWGANERHTLGTAVKTRFSLTPLLVDTGAIEISATAYDSSDRH